MRLLDFLNHKSRYNMRAWGVRAVWRKTDGTPRQDPGEIWNWTVFSTKAEATAWKRDALAAGALRADVTFEVVPVRIRIEPEHYITAKGRPE